jgi:hypothetical protein
VYDRGVGFNIALDDGVGDRILPEGYRTDLGRREDAEFITAAANYVRSRLADHATPSRGSSAKDVGRGGRDVACDLVAAENDSSRSRTPDVTGEVQTTRRASHADPELVEVGAGQANEEVDETFIGSIALLDALYETCLAHVAMTTTGQQDGTDRRCTCTRRPVPGDDNPDQSYEVHLANALHAVAVKTLQPIVIRKPQNHGPGGHDQDAALAAALSGLLDDWEANREDDNYSKGQAADDLRDALRRASEDEHPRHARRSREPLDASTGETQAVGVKGTGTQQRADLAGTVEATGDGAIDRPDSGSLTAAEQVVARLDAYPQAQHEDLFRAARQRANAARDARNERARAAVLRFAGTSEATPVEAFAGEHGVHAGEMTKDGERTDDGDALTRNDRQDGSTEAVSGDE